MARNAARFTNSFRKSLKLLIIRTFYCGGRWSSDRTTYEIKYDKPSINQNLRFSRIIHKASGVMSHGWRMRAYMDRTCSVRETMDDSRKAWRASNTNCGSHIGSSRATINLALNRYNLRIFSSWIPT